MPNERVSTGGTKEFHYSKEDLKRIESEDTESTREFKKALHEWRNKKSQKAKRYVRNTKYKIKNFFRSPRRRRHYNSKPLIKNLFILVIIGILMSIVYANLEKLNDIVLIFLKVGSSLLLVGAFFFVKFIFRLYKNIRYLLRIQRKWVKSLLIILLIVLLIFGYQNKDSLFDPVVDYYDKTDFGIFYPFTFSVDEGISEVGDIFEVDPEQREEAILAFDYVNELREQNGKSEIKFDERVYKLAVDRSKDMYERKYFDHVTPEGTCANSMKSEYNLGSYTLAENVGSSMWGYTEEGADFTTTIDIHEQVDGWMGSRGHRYNLMYDDHVMGAIGCFYGVCVFLGAHTSDYGLGAGPCASGAEGQAYWDSIGKQPGEI